MTLVREQAQIWRLTSTAEIINWANGPRLWLWTLSGALIQTHQRDRMEHQKALCSSSETYCWSHRGLPAGMGWIKLLWYRSAHPQGDPEPTEVGIHGWRRARLPRKESLHTPCWSTLPPSSHFFSWYQHCSAGEGCSLVAWPRGTEKRKGKAGRFRPRHNHGGDRHPRVKGLGGLVVGAKSTCFASCLVVTQKISICHTLPGMAATRVLAAFLHASLNRGHLCAKATFEGDK